MRAPLPLLLAILLLAPSSLAFTLDLAGNLAFGERVELDTDAATGEIRVLAPRPAAYDSTRGLVDCEDFVASQPASSPTGLTLNLDRAGTWRVDHLDAELAESQHFTVTPRDDMRILAQPIPAGAHTDYEIQVARGSTPAAGAYVDILFSDAVTAHYRTDSAGRLFLPHTVLPYAGLYDVAAYMDLDSPLAEYPVAFEARVGWQCDAEDPYDPPELYHHGVEISGSFDAIRVATQNLLLAVEGDSQVRGQDGSAVIHVRDDAGRPVLPTLVQLTANGEALEPDEAGLVLATEAGRITLNGSWFTRGDVTVYVVEDRNGDGEPEGAGRVTVPVERDAPIVLRPRPGSTLNYDVPAPQPDGRPGFHELRFIVLDRDGNEGRPPSLTAANVALSGDLLSPRSVKYDALEEEWVVRATPRNSDADYRVRMQWPGVGTVQIVVNEPPGSGARTTVTAPPPDAFSAGDVRDVAILVERYNSDTKAYEYVSDAHVRLAWADTGATVMYRSGTGTEYPYVYDFSNPRAGCRQVAKCMSDRGTVIFHDVRVERAGAMVAIATVGAGTPNPEYSYAEVPVLPPRNVDTSFLPDVGVAGRLTEYELQSGDVLRESNLEDFHVRILTEDGSDVTHLGRFTSRLGRVYWTAALEAGMYRFHLEEMIDAEADPPRYGLHGTDVMGALDVRPARVRFALAGIPYGVNSIYGMDPTQPQSHNYLLGGGLGGVAQVRVDVVHADGSTPSGFLTLNGIGEDSVAFALLAVGEQDDPARLGAPQLFLPGSPAWIAGRGQSYYFPEIAESREYQGSLRLRYTGQPLFLSVWGTQIGNVTATFEPTSSNLDFATPADGLLHIVPPLVKVGAITTPLGQVANPQALVAGQLNGVQITARDPTGLADLTGVGLGLHPAWFGPSQRAGGTLQPTEDAGIYATRVALQPDATGEVRVVASNGPTVADTGVRLAVLPASTFTFTREEARVLVDCPASALEGTRIDIVVTTTMDPAPEGVLVVLGDTTLHALGGRVNYTLPRVDADEFLRVTAKAPGYPEKVTQILVRNAGGAPSTPPNATPPPGLDRLVAVGLQTSYPEGAPLEFRVLNGTGSPQAGVTGRLGSQLVRTNATGHARMEAPLVAGDKALNLTLEASGRESAAYPVRVVDVGQPSLVLDVPDAVEGGATVAAWVSARDDVGRPMAPPASLRLTIETTSVPLARDGDDADGEYLAPRLIQDVQVLAVLRAPGFPALQQLVTIQGVQP